MRNIFIILIIIYLNPTSSLTSTLFPGDNDQLVSPDLFWRLGACRDGNTQDVWPCVSNGNLVSMFYGFSGVIKDQPWVINTYTNATAMFNFDYNKPNDIWLVVCGNRINDGMNILIDMNTFPAFFQISLDGKLQYYDIVSGTMMNIEGNIKQMRYNGGVYSIATKQGFSSVQSSSPNNNIVTSDKITMSSGSPMTIDALINDSDVPITYSNQFTSLVQTQTSTQHDSSSDVTGGFSLEVSYGLTAGEEGVASASFGVKATGSISKTTSSADTTASYIQSQNVTQTTIQITIPACYTMFINQLQTTTTRIRTLSADVSYCYPIFKYCNKADFKVGMKQLIVSTVTSKSVSLQKGCEQKTNIKS
jgi:hypothetical protein